MKKTYIIPETLVVDIRFNQPLLTGSQLPLSGETTNEVHSRFFSFDEDAEDEEY